MALLRLCLVRVIIAICFLALVPEIAWAVEIFHAGLISGFLSRNRLLTCLLFASAGLFYRSWASTILWWLAGIALCHALSGRTDGFPSTAWSDISAFVAWVSAYCMIPVLSRVFNNSGLAAREFVLAIVIIGAFQGVLAFLQQYTWTRVGDASIWATLWVRSPFHPQDSLVKHFGVVRVAGTFANPNQLAALLAMLWPALLIFPAGRGVKSWYRDNLLKFAAIGVVFAALFMTFTRACLLGLMSQFIFLAFLSATGAPRSARDRCRLALALPSFVAAFLLVSIWIPAVPARVGAVTDGSDLSMTNRIDVWKAAMGYIANRPLAGWGPGSFAIFYGGFDRIRTTNYPFLDVHSALFDWLMALGVVGLGICFLATFGHMPCRTIRRLPTPVGLSLVGMVFPLLAEGPTTHPLLLIPMIVVLAYVASRADRSTLAWTRLLRRRASPVSMRRGMIVSIAFVGLTAAVGAEMLRPFPSLDSMFAGKLAKLWTIRRARTAVVVADVRRRVAWTGGFDDAETSAVLATIERVCPPADGWRAPSGPWAVIPVSMRRDAGPGAGSEIENRIEAMTRTRTRPFPGISDGGGFAATCAALADRLAPTDAASETSGSRGMGVGLTRFRSSIRRPMRGAVIDHGSDIAEMAVVSRDSERWVAAVRCAGIIDHQADVDDTIYRRLGETGWLCHLYNRPTDK